MTFSGSIFFTSFKSVTSYLIFLRKAIAQGTAVKYRNYATPDVAVVLLRAFHEGKGLSKSSQALLLQLMTETTTNPKRIKGLLPEGTVVVYKTGTWYFLYCKWSDGCNQWCRTRNAPEWTTYGDRRFCFRFWGKQCDTRGSHCKSGEGSMGRMEEIDIKAYSEPFL